MNIAAKKNNQTKKSLNSIPSSGALWDFRQWVQAKHVSKPQWLGKDPEQW